MDAPPEEHQANAGVALRKESVDRNITRGQLPTTEPPSLSARRAWIEIVAPDVSSKIWYVALRKESVDRNRLQKKNRPSVGRSLSARRAWIEIRMRIASDL